MYKKNSFGFVQNNLTKLISNQNDSLYFSAWSTIGTGTQLNDTKQCSHIICCYDHDTNLHSNRRRRALNLKYSLLAKYHIIFEN